MANTLQPVTTLQYYKTFVIADFAAGFGHRIRRAVA